MNSLINMRTPMVIITTTIITIIMTMTMTMLRKVTLQSVAWWP